MSSFDLNSSLDESISTNCEDDSILNYSTQSIQTNLPYVLSNLSKRLLSQDDSLEYGRFALEKVLPHLAADDIEEKLLNIACPVLLDAFITAINGINSLNEGLSLTQNLTDSMYALLNSCSIAMQTLDNSIDVFATYDKVDYKNVCSLIKTVKDVIFYAEPLIAKFEGEICGGVFMDDAICLKKKYLKLLTQKVVFDANNDSDIDDLVNIVNSLAKSLLQSSKQSEALMHLADTWKAVIFLAEQYDAVKMLFDGYESITHLSLCLSEFLRNVNPQKSELTTHNLLLKILVKVCKMFTHLPQDCIISIVNLLASLFSLTPTFMLASGYLDTTALEITKNLTIGANPLLSVFSDLPTFPAFLCTRLQEENQKNPYGCLMMLLSLLKKLSASTTARKLYLNGEVNILELVYECLGNCHIGLIEDLYSAPSSTSKEADLYEHVAITVTGFTLCLTANEFILAEKTMWQNILQTNPWRAILASDVLCVVARYADPSLCHSMVRLLVPVLNNMDHPQSRPELVYLTMLLKRLVPLCEADFLDRFCNEQPQSSHPLVLHTLRQQSSAAEENLALDVKKWLNSSSTQIAGLVKLEALSMSRTEGSAGRNVTELVPDLWRLSESSGVHQRYLCAASSITVSAMSALPSHLILEITSTILRISSDSYTCPSVLLSILDFLESTATLKLPPDTNNQAIIEAIANTFTQLLSSKSPVLRMLAWKSLRKYAQISLNTGVIKAVAIEGSSLQLDFISFLKKELPLHPVDLTVPFEYLHRCSKLENICGSEEWKTAKKLKLDQAVADQCHDELNELLCRFEREASQVLLNVGNLNTNQRQRVDGMCQSITSKLSIINS